MRVKTRAQVTEQFRKCHVSGLLATLLGLLQWASQASSPALLAQSNAAAPDSHHSDQRHSGNKHSDSKNTKAIHPELKALQGKLSSISSMSAPFSQTRYLASRSRTLSPEQGLAYFKRPNRFRWIIKNEPEEHWIHDGRRVLNYRPAKKAAIEYPRDNAQARQLLNIVQAVLSPEKLAQDYQVTSIEANDGGSKTLLRLKPRSEVTQVTQVQVTVLHKPKDYVEGLQLTFKNGNKTTLQFKNPRFQTIDDKRFVLPAETKIRAGF